MLVPRAILTALPSQPGLHGQCILHAPSVQAELRGKRLGRPVGGTSLPGMCTYMDRPFAGPDAQFKILPIRRDRAR